ncbi:MAG: carbon-nitrogen hydrolase, partial [Hyphomicrobiales bacterium]
MVRKFSIALVQVSLNGSPEENLAKALAWARKAAQQGGQVICLPELYRSFYFCQKEDSKYFDLAEPLHQTSFTSFSDLAKALGVVLIVPFFEKRAAGLYHNSAYIIDTNGSEAGLYRKMHIPDDPCFYEKFYFAPGDLGFKAVSTSFGKIGTLICWDQWYPEGARITALKGASVLFFPTAIGWHPHEKEKQGARQMDAWMTVQRGHAIANGIYVAAVNRVGFEQPEKDQAGLEFWGSSLIAGPQGEIVARASTDQEEILVADVDLDRMEYVRRNWPFLR